MVLRTLNYIMTHCNTTFTFWQPCTYKATLRHLQPKAHKFWHTQPTISAALLRIQLRITPIMPGNASAAFTSNLPSSYAKGLSLFLTHFLKPLSSLGGGLPPPPSTPQPPGSKASTKTPIAIPIAVSMEAIVISCSRNRVRIFSANEVSNLSNTFATVSLKLVIWSFYLPLRRSMLSCLTDRSSLYFAILFLMSSLIPLSICLGFL